MIEHPILMNGAMVRATLSGVKTQTRRIVKPDPGPYWNPVVGLYNPTVIANGGYEAPGPEIFGASDETAGRKCPYGQPGDKLWVRETWVCDHFRVQSGPYLEVDDARDHLFYRADNEQPFESPEGKFWKPSIHMPRWASRILLEIVSVRIERLNDCSEADARAEGLKRSQRAISGAEAVPCYWDYLRNEPNYHDARSSFSSLWESINGVGSWDMNPFVWILEFKRVTP